MANAPERELDRTPGSIEMERARLEAVFRQAPSYLSITRGAEHRYDHANAAFLALVGCRDVTGLRVVDVIPELSEQGFMARLDAVLAMGEPFVGREVPLQLRRTDGGGVVERFVDFAYLPLVDADGTRVGVIAHGTDVTDHVHARREVERLLAESERARAEAETARGEAEAANRVKAEFLTTMSHELRTPLNAIGGYAELMELGLRGPVSDEQRRDLGRIQESQRHLLGLVNEVLDLAKSEAGELRIECQPVRAGDTVDAALALVRPQAASRALSLSETCGGAADRPYLGDEPRVRQVLVNLLGNAIKFTPPGGDITVSCVLTDTPPAGRGLASGAPYVAFRVEDTGVGIPADERERIFEPFTQVAGGATAYTRSAGGTGLGLAISRRLARLMGGELTVDARDGGGSTFALWLPTIERRTRSRRAVSDGPGRAGETRRREPSATDAQVSRSLARIGTAIVAQTDPIIRDWVARLRADPVVPTEGCTDAELEDHGATFLTDIGLAIRALDATGGEPTELLRDGRAILAIVSERHGAQRARLKWPEVAISQEIGILAELLHAVIDRVAQPEDVEAAARAHVGTAQLLMQAERLSLAGFRLAEVPHPRQEDD